MIEKGKKEREVIYYCQRCYRTADYFGQTECGDCGGRIINMDVPGTVRTADAVTMEDILSEQAGAVNHDQQRVS